jgi:hypothetical protein
MCSELWFKSLKRREHSEGIGEKIKIDDTEIRLESVHWIHLDHDSDQWRLL